MRALIASRSALLHVLEGRIVEAVGTEWHAPVLAHRVDEQLEVIEWTLEFAVELDAAGLGQIVGVLAELAVDSLRLGGDQLHVAATLTAAADRLAHGRQRRKRVLKQLLNYI